MIFETRAERDNAVMTGIPSSPAAPVTSTVVIARSTDLSDTIVARGGDRRSRTYDAGVSSSGPDDPNDPFSGLPFFGDLAKLFATGDDPINWDAAKQFAVNLANGGVAEPNVDPADRFRLRELSRIAELQVVDRTGLDVTFDGVAPVVVPVTRAEWANRTLNDYRPLLEVLAKGLQTDAADESGTESDPAAQLFGGLMRMVAPMMMAMSAGSMVGHLAERALGAYDLAIPRPRGTEIIVAGPNLRAFCEEWSVPYDDIGLWLCVHELLHHALFNVAHVRDAMTDLLTDFVGGFRAGESLGLENKLGTLDPSMGMEQMQKQLGEVLGDPEVLLGAMRSSEQDHILPRLEALVTVILGWVDHHLELIGSKLVGSSEQLTEALRRRRVTAGPQDRFVEKMLGLDLRPELIERGRSFITGVVSRGGEEALGRLWDKHENLPTPNEVDAPGLWLARIDLPA